MAQRLKSWESPRYQGRNSKGKGGSARQRQLKKQRQMLRKKLQGETPQSKSSSKSREENLSSLLFLFMSTDLSLLRMPGGASRFCHYACDINHKISSAALT
ncbi:hypothetical protein [Planktothricoides raciborskii]|uniref:Uncharacterized protein n=1 Tax=Planktothricoides raciborskii GIHE-MW2 TaxID=2792601 RepID=A0AAU8JLB9_9CYAN